MKIKTRSTLSMIKPTGIREYQFLVFFVILVLLLVSSITNLQIFTKTTNKLNDALSLNSQLIRIISTIDTTYGSLVIDLQRFIFEEDESALSSMYAHLANMKNLEQQANYYVSEVKKENAPSDPIVAEISQQLSKVDPFIDMIVLYQLDGKFAEAKSAFIAFEDNELLELKVTLNDYIRTQQQVIDNVIHESKTTKSNMFILLILQNAVVWLVCFGLAFYLEQIISKPIIAISNQFKSISLGDLDSEIGDDINASVLEILALTMSANNMRLRLRESFNEVKSYNASLELRVLERTIELEDSYRNLQLAMQDLKTSQDKLVSFRKQEILNQFIRNLLHRVNTPLGTAVLSTDLIKTTLVNRDSTLDMATSISSITDCLEMIIGSHRRIIDTMTNLNTLLEIDHTESYGLIDMSGLIIESIMSLSMKSNQLTSLSYSCPKDLVVSLQRKNLKSLLINVFEYILLSNAHPLKEENLVLTCNQIDAFLVLDIYNPIIHFEDEMPTDLIEYLFSHMGIGEDLNLELATIISTVSNGMNGTVTLLRTLPKQTILRIELPVQNSSKGE